MTPAERRIGIWIAGAIFLGILLLITTTIFPGFGPAIESRFLARDVAAGWVQGVGTVAAVVAAGWLARKQSRDAEAARRSQQRVFSAALSIKLLPKLRMLHASVSEGQAAAEKALLAMSGDTRASPVEIRTPANGNAKFVRKHWKEVSDMDRDIAAPIVRAIAKFDLANASIDHCHRTRTVVSSASKAFSFNLWELQTRVDLFLVAHEYRAVVDDLENAIARLSAFQRSDFEKF